MEAIYILRILIEMFRENKRSPYVFIDLGGAYHRIPREVKLTRFREERFIKGTQHD